MHDLLKGMESYMSIIKLLLFCSAVTARAHRC
jgi:hypothetical protein